MFKTHKLSPNGFARAEVVAEIFTETLERLERLCVNEFSGREMAVVRTKLQEACFFAKRAIAVHPDNQDGGAQ